jgi:hypothetical protein
MRRYFYTLIVILAQIIRAGNFYEIDRLKVG